MAWYKPFTQLYQVSLIGVIVLLAININLLYTIFRIRNFRLFLFKKYIVKQNFKKIIF